MFKSLAIYCEKNFIRIGIYGLICGMNLLLSGNTINFWLASYKIDAKTIGFFSLIAIPYVFKFFISIFINHNNIIYLSKKVGRYKSWLIVTQFIIFICLIGNVFLNPERDLILIAFFGTVISFCAVIQDVIFNYSRIKILEQSLQPAGSAIYNVGYRLGMLFAGAGIMFASIYIGWDLIYLSLALIYGVFAVVIMFLYQEDSEIRQKERRAHWYHIFTNTFEGLVRGRNFIWVILFILLYRLADNMLVIMLNPFLMDIGYDVGEIASISKSFGIMMVIIGGIISAPIIMKFNTRTSLIGFSAIHMLGHGLFIALTFTGKNIPLLYFLTAYEAVTGGMMTVVYFSFISNLCKGKNTAAQYALLSSGIGLSRVIFPASSGVIVDYGFIRLYRHRHMKK